MKTVFIDCSPKKKLSASGFIAGITSAFVFGKKERVKLRTKSDYQKVSDTIDNADNVVFAMPLYVDGVPSHILPFMKEIEDCCKEKQRDTRVYVIANNGFIEGRQNEPLMQVMENFCVRSNLTWCGGLGIGGGVMMNVLRILAMVFFFLMLLQMVAVGVMEGNFFPVEPMMNFGKQLLVLLLLGSGILIYDVWLALCINGGKTYGKHYTRIMLPSFVFILVTDIFFTIISVFSGGVFRGWFARKKP